MSLCGMRSGVCTAARRQQGLPSGARWLYDKACCTLPVQLLACEMMCSVGFAGHPHIWLVDVLCLQAQGCGGSPAIMQPRMSPGNAQQQRH